MLVLLALCGLAAAGLDTSFRLPPNLVPVAYRLHLNFSLTHALHGGLVELDFAAAADTRDLVLHSLDHVFLSRGSLACSAQSLQLLPFPYRDMDKQIAVFEGVDVPAGARCTLRLPFAWALSGTKTGPFTESPATFHLISKFQPAAARKLFPCLDEPALKATFQLNLYLPPETASHVLVRSNTDLARPPRHHASGLLLHEFKPTPHMSTYLVALVIANASVPLVASSVGRPRVEALGFTAGTLLFEAAQLVQATTRALDRRFPVTNPMDKITFAKVDKYPSGATEHWGLITSRSLNTMIIIHETVHQWFGNMVTCDWWDDIWLNEGLTNFVNCQVMDELRNQGWKVWSTEQCFAKWRRHAEKDALTTNIRLSDPRNYPTFQVFAYTVGPTFLRMLQGLLGEELMESVLSEYIRRFAYATATTEDFVALVEEMAHPKHPVRASWKTEEAVEMGPFLLSWIKAPHLPRVTVAYDAPRREFVLRQSCPVQGCHQRWFIPIRSYRSPFNIGPNSVVNVGHLSPRYRTLSAFYWLTPRAPEIRVRTEQADLVWNPTQESFIILRKAAIHFM